MITAGWTWQGLAVPDPWNFNIRNDALLDALVPATARRVCDVGCGDGFLSARLARRVPEVTAVDADAPVLERARTRFPDSPVTWLHADVMTAELAPRSFDAVVSNATLHHLDDAAAALARLGGLLVPGGTLAAVTFVRGRPQDLPWQAVAWAFRSAVRLRRSTWEHSAPVRWPPADTLPGLRRAASTTLPGARVRRLVDGRVLLTWTAPPGQRNPGEPPPGA